MEITDILLNVYEIVGTVSFAVSGAMIGIQRRLDAFGVVALGMVTAFGGGAIRDLLIGYIPPRCFYDYGLLGAACGASLLVFVLAYAFREQYLKRETLIDNINNIADAIGLAAFTVAGFQAALAAGHGHNPCFCIFLGMLTGVGGGMLRDMMSCTIPMVFTKRIYAVASIAGGIIYFLCLRVGVPGTVSAFIAMAVVIIIRILATLFRWSLPKIRIYDEK